MGDPLSDLISDLPQSIIENILTRLPIRVAIRTSLLSSKWRYKWSTITDLVFDENCVTPAKDCCLVENKFVKFVSRALFLHQGPIHKFQVSLSFVLSCPEVDQWLLHLSRNGIKELVLELGEGEWFQVPSCLYNYQKLTGLDLSYCKLDPPLSFNGFPYLRSLSLYQCLAAPEVLEYLFASCPVLENLTISSFDGSIPISAPNLKCLYLDGDFNDIFLENTPNLVDLSVYMYTYEESDEPFDHIPSCNLVEVLGGVPCLERLVGYVYFTKYLSLGINTGRLPVTYFHLKTIELYQVCFEDANEVLVLLRLISHSPNLGELKVSGSPNHYQLLPPEEDSLDFWKQECPLDYKLDKLKLVKMMDFSGIRNELDFIKFLLANSPMLEVMTIVPPCLWESDADARANMLIELLKFKRASSRSEILFIKD